MNSHPRCSHCSIVPPHLLEHVLGVIALGQAAAARQAVIRRAAPAASSATMAVGSSRSAAQIDVRPRAPLAELSPRLAALDPRAIAATLRMDDGFRRNRPKLHSRRQGNKLLRAAAALRAAQAGPNKQITIFDCAGSTALPGTRRRRIGDPATGDAAVDEAFEGLSKTFDFYWQVFNRDSLDDQGLPLEASVHYGHLYDNAEWTGDRMVFGDGDGVIFQRFTLALDIVAHELTHGLTQHMVGLEYERQAGALNEHLSDVFGSLVKQHALGQSADQADWLIGNGIFEPGINGKAIRSMAAPGSAYDDQLAGKDPQPSHMRDFVKTTKDNGGVHINSGIPNHAFYRLAMALGGNAWEKAGRIWYGAMLTGDIKPKATFKEFAKVTHEVAGSLGKAEQAATKKAWGAVGITW